MKNLNIGPSAALAMISFFVPYVAGGQTVDQEQKWTELIRTKDLSELVELIEHPSSLTWPTLKSDQTAKLEGLPTIPSDIGLALLDKVRSYETSSGKDKDESLKVVQLYSSLSDGLQKAGGYINLCLADAVDRLALARLAGILVANPSDTDQIQTFLNGVSCASFSADKFIQMINNETVWKLRTGSDLTKLEKGRTELQILDALGTDPVTVLGNFSSGQAGTSKLIENPQPALLLERMIQTDVVYVVDLKALIAFLQRGGKFDDLNPKDIRPFIALMKGQQMAFRSEVGNVHTSVTYLHLFVEQYKNQSSKNEFSEIALQ